MKQPHGPPMTLGNMRELGVARLIASCLNDACRHTALVDCRVIRRIPRFRGFAPVLSAPSAAAEATRSTLGPTGKSSRRARA
jgi:hypothetical protein